MTQNELERLKRRTGCDDEQLLADLYEDAESYVLTYTGRTLLPDVLRKTVRDLTVIAFNRRGTEGEASRSESGESYSFNDAPKEIYSVLNRYRLARIGGKVYEAQANED